ncbi:class I SAM-dependent methyltransferase [Virgibacillus flavescens]|uniref:class I SAM-dependent methyltransferase n=1 Tax=Virgibacillus flavescens TaxID=1611422 RepID=UPI003D336D56
MKDKENVKKAFAKNSNAYVTSSTHGSGIDLPLLIEWLNPNSSMIALDIATGGGHVAKQLSPHVKKVIATDLTEEMLTNTATHLKQFTNISFTIADAEELPFEDNSFHIVTCRIAAHHFPHPENFISEVSRVLKPNGKFIFIDNIAPERVALDNFVNKFEKMRDYSHVRSLPITKWKQYLTSYQLPVLHEKTRKKTLPYNEWLNRMVDDKEKKREVTSYMKDAPENLREYFQIKLLKDQVHSFAIDEWMVMCMKK